MEGGRRSWVREGPLWAHVGHRRTAVDFPKADKAFRGLTGRDGQEADTVPVSEVRMLPNRKVPVGKVS